MLWFRHKTACFFLLTILLWLPYPILGSAESYSSQPEKPLKWNNATVTVSIPKTINTVSGISSEAFRETAMLAANSWERFAAINIRFRETDVVSISPAGLKGDGINLLTNTPSDENLRLFSSVSEGLPASTRIFFDKLGNITEADVALNPFVEFSIDGTFGTYDLQAVLTHEFGHMLGLQHSSVLSSRMYESIPKNGLLNANRFVLRQLTTIDVAAIRAKYSSRPETTDCCTSISGTINTSSGVAWLSNTATGRLFAVTQVSSAGRFTFNGLPEDSYRIFAQGTDESPFDAVQLGEINPEIGNTTRVKNSTPTTPSTVPSPKYIGVRGQLGSTAIRLTQGESERVFLGTPSKENLSDISIGIDSSHFQVIPGSSFVTRYNRDLTSISADIKVSMDTPPGSYSIFIQNSTGSRRYLIGAIEILTPLAEQ